MTSAGRILPSGERLIFLIVLSLSLVASVAGLWLAVVHHKPNYAERGGSVGLTLALMFVFITRDYGRRWFRAVGGDEQYRQRIKRIASLSSGEIPAVTEKPDIADRVLLLEKSIAIDARARVTENVFIALATAVATLLMGFSEPLTDMLSGWFAS